MQTTLRIDDDLYREAKAKAAASGQSLTQFLEEAIRERLHHAKKAHRKVRLPVSSKLGGLRKGFKTLGEAADAADLVMDRKRVR